MPFCQLNHASTCKRRLCLLLFICLTTIGGVHNLGPSLSAFGNNQIQQSRLQAVGGQQQQQQPQFQPTAPAGDNIRTLSGSGSLAKLRQQDSALPAPSQNDIPISPIAVTTDTRLPMPKPPHPSPRGPWVIGHSYDPSAFQRYLYREYRCRDQEKQYFERQCLNTGECAPGFYCSTSEYQCGKHWCVSYNAGA